MHAGLEAAVGCYNGELVATEVPYQLLQQGRRMADKQYHQQTFLEEFSGIPFRHREQEKRASCRNYFHAVLASSNVRFYV